MARGDALSQTPASERLHDQFIVIVLQHTEDDGYVVGSHRRFDVDRNLLPDLLAKLQSLLPVPALVCFRHLIPLATVPCAHPGLKSVLISFRTHW